MDEKRGEQLNSSDSTRDFAYLNTKSPSELIEEMETLIDGMDAESFDTELINAYLTVLQQKAPVMEDSDPEVALTEFMAKHEVLIENLDLPKPEPTAQRQKVSRRPRLRLAYVAAIVCILLFGATVTANAYGVNVVDVIVNWGEEVLHLSRRYPTSGQMELPADSEAEYLSMEDALSSYGLDTSACPTWIPERFSLTGLEVQVDGNQLLFSAQYQDEAGKSLIFFIDYAPDIHEAYHIEMDSASGQIYRANGVEYYLLTNIGECGATWLDQENYYSLSGMVTEDELKQMIDSIQER